MTLEGKKTGFPREGGEGTIRKMEAEKKRNEEQQEKGGGREGGGEIEGRDVGVVWGMARLRVTTFATRVPKGGPRVWVKGRRSRRRRGRGSAMCEADNTQLFNKMDYTLRQGHRLCATPGQKGGENNIRRVITSWVSYF